MKITCAHVLCCRMLSVLVLGVLSSGVAFLAKAVGGPVTAVRVQGFSHAVLSSQYFRTEGPLKRLVTCRNSFLFVSAFPNFPESGRTDVSTLPHGRNISVPRSSGVLSDFTTL